VMILLSVKAPGARGRFGAGTGVRPARNKVNVTFRAGGAQGQSEAAFTQDVPEMPTLARLRGFLKICELM
jgi:hypothetical protein